MSNVNDKTLDIHALKHMTEAEAKGDESPGVTSVRLISRPMASATAAVSEPALPTLANTSKGLSSPFELMVI